MSLQKAIDILDVVRERGFIINIRISGFEDGFDYAREVLRRNCNNEIHLCDYQPSDDTPYKKSLTAWIERKARYDWVEPESPYSIFETWQKVCSITTEEGEG